MKYPQKEPQLFLGIDSSTQGCKLIVIDIYKEQAIYSDSVNYDRDLPEYQTLNGVIRSEEPGVSEANPNMWIDALHLLFNRMNQGGFPMQEINAISVSGQQHGLVTLDAEGNLTRQTSKLWNDYSTTKECEELTASLGGPGKMIAETGNTQRPGYTAGKILHFCKHDPDAFSRTTTFFLVHNFINWFLTGAKNNGVRVMEPGDVSGMALRHPGTDHWSKKVCSAISPDLIQKLPPVKPADAMIGAISPELVEKYGFPPECQIDAGCGDNMYGAVGTGNVKPGIVTISLGTSGTAYTIFDTPYVDPVGEISSFCDSTGRYMPLLCVSNMANGYNKILEIYQINHREFAEIISETPPGNHGRILFPWYMGERTPDLPFAAPVYWGFDLDDFRKPLLCRAVLEGHILNLFDGYRKMPVKAKEIRLTGGLSRSEAWRQTIADVFEAETVPVEGEGPALGAAIHAAWVYLKQTDTSLTLQSLTGSFVQLNESQRKYPHNAAAYREMKDVYREMSLRLRTQVGRVDAFEQLQKLRS
jgi:xylulokinase